MKLSKRRLLGQHMLTDRRVLEKIIEVASISQSETVLEAGTGEGALTTELCKIAKSIVSFEVDHELFKRSSRLISSFPNLKLINADVFKFPVCTFDVFISNLPYSRSRDAVQWLALQKFSRAILTVQKEFADKLQARPGDKNYRSISVITQNCFFIERLFHVPKGSFDPQPSVESTVMKLVPKEPWMRITRPTIKNLNLLFSSRNRKIFSVLKKHNHKIDFAGTKRIGELQPAQLLSIAESI
ncbi:MAG TPA: 16S rRNA (adenine(1518)-N(6)/adenine(1519)-N(6))-dimethyltransferase RsmA [Candidatus Nitrosopolaris sp.]|nr:16S rRNA (adenine(1518)-N(6)/adenine(1519)-N(6))-dimethyltransferase RsmA [Candidatus Nitrosopolaris sp.]